jgi:hypothetical protein
VCPVRFITPEADYVLRMFARCYAPVAMGLGAVMWQRVALPDPGSVRDQDAWLLSALDYVRDVQNAMTAEAIRRRPKKRADSVEPAGHNRARHQGEGDHAGSL